MSQKENKILDLTVTYQWFDMIKAGVKTEEYRKIKPYWEKRLLDYDKLSQYYETNKEELLIKKFMFPGHAVIEDACASFPRGYEAVRFHRGYSDTTVMFRCDGIKFGIGKEEWGAPKDELVFIISLGERILSPAERVSESVQNTIETVIDKELRENKVLSDVFTDEEMLAMAYIPIVFAENIWMYIDRVMCNCRLYLIPETKRLTRAVSEIKDTYYKWLQKTIDRRHMENAREVYRNFEDKFGADMACLWMTIKGEMERNYPDAKYMEMRIDAHCAIVLVRVLKRYSSSVDSEIRKRLDRKNVHTLSPYLRDLDQIMEGYIGNYTIERKAIIRSYEDLIYKDMQTIKYKE